MSRDVAQLLRDRRLIVTAGAGGVGKTTTAAALAVQSAHEGRRTAVLTIDPARRLANSLGLEAFTEQGHRVALEGGAELQAMMLDTKSTADQMVRQFAPDAESVRRILDNRYYQAFSTYLAGTQEYMAIERVAELIDEGGFDLVVLDTPPATHALDFIDAPERMLNALDNRAMNWLYRPAKSAPGFGTRLLGKGRQVITRSLDKFTGGPFFEDLATFLSAFSALFGAFKDRSRRVKALLREPTTAFLVVAAPSPASVVDSLTFAEKLQERGLPFGTFVCNRVHRPLAAPTADVADHLRAALPDADGPFESLAAHMRAGLADHNRMAARDAAAIDRLTAAAERAPAVVPLLPEDVHDLRGLAEIGRCLVSP
jgi:anion-transporting  ArsA/GET3 family ATPase